MMGPPNMQHTQNFMQVCCMVYHTNTFKVACNFRVSWPRAGFYLIQHGLVSGDGHLAAMQVLHQLLERGVMVAASSSGAAAGGGGGARVDLAEGVACRL